VDRMICEDRRIGSTARFSDNSFSLFFSLCLLLPDRFLLTSGIVTATLVMMGGERMNQRAAERGKARGAQTDSR
jgi:hypothetical protein